MTTAQSSVYIVNKENKKVFDFLSDLSNLESIIPENRVKGFYSDHNCCSFRVDGIGEVSFRIVQRVPYEIIRLESGEKSPFKFELNIRIGKTQNLATQIELTLNAELNPSMKMMIGSYLNKGVDKAAEELSKFLEDNLE